MKLHHLPLLAAILVSGPDATAAPAFPTQPVRIVVPHQAGSTTETFGRMLTPEMSTLLGQPIVIESRPGAAGTIGARDVALSKPDGYTGLMNASIQVMYPGIFKTLHFDPIKDFTPVGVFGFAPMVAVVRAQSPIQSFRGLIDAARAKPGSITFASGGLGSLPHLVGELVNVRSDVQISHIPYNGTGQALTDVLGGHVDVLYASVASVLPQIKGGKLRALAVTSAARNDLLPDVPTIAESGIPDFDVTSWYGYWVPKATPRAVVDRLNQAMREASAMPAVARRLAADGIIPSKMNADEFAAFAASENEKWLDVMKRAKVQPN
ncbi:tripartite tricarboxylate transporter substrate binding protein [Achromobacter denitrificans]|uniref:Tripartite tricarboxylate transporter substrate binding protein n=2 Tax=Achromobacter denitrificans TaxID=32002 RepID=A0A427WI10_ACHDE|nr:MULTISPECIES: tripartite tricarboxylate transporter substrate binding protein [Achromobacter]MBV2159130.1 tripartite tricarboxylate transporter substrate binding protein [Achromobacter denitrificans]MDF3847243.1 tripartite tricarboxylate transporter substrate binding protein [Achromobacter denitrificans]MDF3862088.1 tripartite tricarboxylate transporter substrate binding protein [Achromobacter denitrificans]MDX3882082.1 tripartite tricarboxylate transporter substrate binding protein [Achromo